MRKSSEHHLLPCSRKGCHSSAAREVTFLDGKKEQLCLDDYKEVVIDPELAIFSVRRLNYR